MKKRLNTSCWPETVLVFVSLVVGLDVPAVAQDAGWEAFEPVVLRYAPRRAGAHVESMPWVRGKQQMTHALLVTLATWARALPWEPAVHAGGTKESCPYSEVESLADRS